MAHRQQRRKLQSCEGCRAAHARCDVQLPTCGRCVLLSTACVRGKPLPFRYSNSLVEEAEANSGGRNTTKARLTRSNSTRRREASKAEFEFADDQVWVATQGDVEFVFEYVPGLSTSNDDSGDEDEEDEDEEEESEVSTPPPLFVATSPVVRGVSVVHNSPPSNRLHGVGQQGSPVRPDSAVLPSPDTSPQDSLWLPAQRHGHPSPDTGGGDGSNGSAAGYSSSRSVSFILTPTTASAHLASPHHLLRRHWPLENDHEATLLRHFVTDLSSWFDYGDPQNTFATSVVQCAASSPPLLNAIFAVSSRHLSLKAGEVSALADSYHRTCLKLLIPLLNDTNAALDERLYAATVILRLYEEIMGQDMENHLMGTHTFVRLQEYAQSSAIRQAVFRVALRQEIVISFRTQRPVQLLREYVRADQSLSQSLGQQQQQPTTTAAGPIGPVSPGAGGPGSAEDDWSLAFHMFVLCAEVLTFCYGEDEPKTPQSWDDLAWRAQKWVDTIPLSYEPLLNRPPGIGQAFPTIMLLNDCHVAARQHYLLSQILLAAHDPRRPHLGPRAAESTKATNAAIQEHVRNLCGITLSNAHCVPSMFTACIAIAICGDLFTELMEQKAMFDILVKTDLELAWPTAAIQSHLQERWGWP